MCGVVNAPVGRLRLGAGCWVASGLTIWLCSSCVNPIGRGEGGAPAGPGRVGWELAAPVAAYLWALNMPSTISCKLAICACSAS